MTYFVSVYKIHLKLTQTKARIQNYYNLNLTYTFEVTMVSTEEENMQKCIPNCRRRQLGICGSRLEPTAVCSDPLPPSITNHILCVVMAGPAWASTDETRLFKNLFTGYNKVVRPVHHFKDPVVVTVGLQLIQLISVVRRRIIQASF